MAGVSACILVLIATFYLLFQNKPVYDATLGHITKTYHNDGNRIYKDHAPYEKFAEEKMYRWDADLYRNIADNGYSIQAAGGDYIFAFFPLFPFIWKFSGLNAFQISLLNYFFYVASLIILIMLFAGKDNIQKWRYMLVLVGIPMLFVFLIPYTEGLFMLTMTLALWGILKNRYLLYFTGALLASMTRQSASILMLALFFTELYFFFRHRSFAGSLKSCALKILPLLTGTAIVSVIQLRYGSNHLLKFIEVEKHWGYKLQWPGTITDWAHEQFCTNLPLATIVLPIFLSYLGYSTIKTLLRIQHKIGYNIQNPAEDESREYLFILSIIYIIGVSLTILTLRGGLLNNLSRYVFCTPFYLIVLFMLQKNISNFSRPFRVTLLISVFIIAISVFFFVDYSRSWNFSDLGFFLFFFQIAFFIFTKMISNNWALAAFTFLTALWTSYLFSMFISNAWIVT